MALVPSTNISPQDLRLMRFLTYQMSQEKEILFKLLDSERKRPQEEIAKELCGLSGRVMAIQFMNGNKTQIDAFLDNVEHCGEKATVLIILAIQKHIQKRTKEFNFK